MNRPHVRVVVEMLKRLPFVIGVHEMLTPVAGGSVTLSQLARMFAPTLIHDPAIPDDSFIMPVDADMWPIADFRVFAADPVAPFTPYNAFCCGNTGWVPNIPGRPNRAFPHYPMHGTQARLRMWRAGLGMSVTDPPVYDRGALTAEVGCDRVPRSPVTRVCRRTRTYS